MIRTPRCIRARPLAALALALALAAAPAHAAGVSVALMPASQSVSPGATFDLTLDVTAAGAGFNGFDAVVSWDPGALTLVPLSPTTLQQGCLMTGGCSAACGTTFHVFDSAADSAAVTDVLLCDQVTLTGPGHLYTLRFSAADSAQLTHVRVRRASFYSAGVVVSPVTTADCTIGIGVPVGVPAGEPAPRGLSVSATPNPARGAVALALSSDTAGPQTLDVFDAAGRHVRRLASGWQPAGARRVRWDGADEAGRRVPPGLYLVTLAGGARHAQARVVVLE